MTNIWDRESSIPILSVFKMFNFHTEETHALQKIDKFITTVQWNKNAAVNFRSQLYILHVVIQTPKFLKPLIVPCSHFFICILSTHKKFDYKRNCNLFQFDDCTHK